MIKCYFAILENIVRYELFQAQHNVKIVVGNNSKRLMDIVL